MPVPIVFISSTSEDLKPYRAKAELAAKKARFFPRMMEYFTASGAHKPLGACMEEISGSAAKSLADVLVVIVAHRYGWVPDDQPGADRKSITWLECEEALRFGREVLAFLVDETHPWPEESKEEYQVTDAVRQGTATLELLQTIQQNVASLREFKKWLNGQGIRSTFTNSESLYGEVLDALHQWLDRHPEFHRAAAPPEDAANPTRYFECLRDHTSHIDIRGLQIGTGRATRFPIEELYIRLTTTIHEPVEGGRAGGTGGKIDPEGRGSVRTELHQALKNPRLVIAGDPGSGKTTFLRRIANLLCLAHLDDDAAVVRDQLGLDGRPLPILIRLAELAEHIASCRGNDAAPTTAESPDWLAHYAATTCEETSLGLGKAFFRAQLENGSALVLLDGLDEAPSEAERRRLTALVEKATDAYQGCRFVLTSRPVALRGEVVLPKFAQVGIDALDDQAIETFLRRWCEGLFTDSPGGAEAHCQELTEALRAKPEIRRMARNPVMLTALAVVHWCERRLPEQRADLYESILSWLARAREKRPGRPAPDRCIVLHQELALAMQDHPEGRQVRVPRYWAARAIAPHWRELPEEERVQAAEKFLVQEELDSGIVVGRGDHVRFWHLTFQEFLAARALAARSEEEQRARLIGTPALYLPEWKEAVLLLAGVLYHQGIQRVDGMVSAVLAQLGQDTSLSHRAWCFGLFGSRASLAARARCFGLLGAAVQDLTPVNYHPTDPRYKKLADEVLGIFDAERSASVAIGVAIEAAEALGQVGDPRFAPHNPENNWVEIPASEFRMGAQNKDPSKPSHDSEAYDTESPVHKVYLDAYRIGRYPVTVGEYSRFVDGGGYRDGQYWQAGGFGECQQHDEWEGQLQHPNRPVVCVSWYEAAAYAAWAKCRLPTEAEWERAARGTEGRKYPWGPHPKPNPSLGNYRDSKVGHSTPVGVYPRGATPDGILDMAGNVLEWCQDRFGVYPGGEVRNPTGPDGGDGRLVRGGCCLGGARHCRGAYRNKNHPTSRYDDIGFRLVVCFGGQDSLL